MFHRTQVETPWGPTLRQADGGVYRFEPRTWKFETYIPFNFPNPHGHVFDRWGRDIVFDATGGQPYYGPSFSTKKYYPAMETKAAPKPGDVRTRPVGGAEILSSRHFPEAMQGNLIVLNTIGFRGLLNYKITEDGAGLKSTEVEPILQSADENFRPGRRRGRPRRRAVLRRLAQPDHRPHAAQPPRHVARSRARPRLSRDLSRAVRCSSPRRSPAQPIPQLLDLLKEPENRVRYRAKIELSGARHQGRDVARSRPGSRALDAKDPGYEHHMMEALWVHQWHNRVDEKLLARMLRSSDPWARAAATRVLCYWRDRVANPLALLKTQATDEHPAVRLEAVRAASFFQTAEAAEVALASLESAAGSLPHLHARPDDGHAQALRCGRHRRSERRTDATAARDGAANRPAPAVPDAQVVNIHDGAGEDALRPEVVRGRGRQTCAARPHQRRGDAPQPRRRRSGIDEGDRRRRRDNADAGGSERESLRARPRRRCCTPRRSSPRAKRAVIVHRAQGAWRVHLRLHLSRPLGADVRRDARRPEPGRVEGEAHGADGSDDRPAIHRTEELSA